MVFTIDRKDTGRKVGKSCKKPTRSNRRKRSHTRFTRVGAFAQQAQAGKNTKKFSGRIGGKKLSPATYRGSLVATDAAGNRSLTKSTEFTVLRP